MPETPPIGPIPTIDPPKIRVLTVEDEPLGQEKLRNLLAREPQVEWVGQAFSGTEAVTKIRELRPDLVFLDINLPGCTGFSVLERLGKDLPRAVIFVTAHDEFAIRAFEVHAVDYVLKPLDRVRFKAALQRALDRLGNRTIDDLTGRLDNLLAQLPGRAPVAPERIAIREPGRIVFINLHEIDWIGSADNYVEIHAGPQKHLLRETITAMEHRLAGDTFVRISRTTLVNRHRIRELQPLFNGQYAVLLRDGTKLTLSRTHRDQLKRLGVS